MNFLPFEENRNKMLLQYYKAYESLNIEESEHLYTKIKEIYDKEQYKVLGKGKALKYFLENVEIFINPNDIFADLCSTENTPLRIRKDVYGSFHKKKGEAKILTDAGAIFANGDYGHTSPDWEKLLKLGFTGIAEEANSYLQRENLSDSQRAFYTSVKLTYEGIVSFVKRLSVLSKSVISKNSAFTAQNLDSLANGAPKNTAEAMQLYFIYYTVQQKHDGAVLRSLGALNELLYPFYKSDLDNGVFSEEELRELIKYFLFKWHTMKVEANIPFDLSDEPNELTYIIIDEYVKLDIHDPKIHIKCSERTPDRLIKAIMQAIRGGNNSFVFINDRVVKKSLINIGVDPLDAERYTLIGCYEPGVIGKELPCTVNGKINMPLAVEYAIKHICESGNADIVTFDELYSAVKVQLAHFIDVSVNEINTIEEKYPKIFQSPTLSASYESCMTQGIDVYSGGAKYNNSSISLFGLATFVDALIAIKRAVYVDKEVSLRELLTILYNNWQGAESLRLKIRNEYAKYGNGDLEADELARDIVEFLAGNVNGRSNGRGGVYRLGLFSIDWIFMYGKKVGASADGRYKGEPLSKNLSATVGMDKKGVTGLIRSALSFDHSLAPDGAVLDLALHPTSVSGDEGIEIMQALLKTYFTNGGFAMQMNIVSRETLEAAQREPDKYRNLQIRLCGWNVYFTELDAEVQNNIIESMANQ